MMLELGIGNCGLALFIFLSGYSLMIKRREINNLVDARSYLVRRIQKLFPIYWLGLLTLYIVQTFQLLDQGSWGVQLVGSNALQYIIIISGLQILFTNALFTPEGLVYWFVSAIMVYYFLFPMLLLGAKRLGKSFARSLFMVALVVFIAMVGIAFLYPGIDSRLYAFYWFFIAGIILGRSSALNDVRTNALTRTLALSAIGSIIAFSLGYFLELFLVSITFLDVHQVFEALYVLVYGAIGIILAIYFTNVVKNHLHGRVLRLVQRTALATYPIYIFHYYCLLLAASLALYLGPAYVPIVVLLLGVPLAIMFPPYIQDVVDYVMAIPSRNARIRNAHR